MQADAISAIMALLSEPDLLPYAVAVLNNFMVDYGKTGNHPLSSGMLTLSAPAQKQASNAKLSARLVDLLSSPDIDAFQSQLGMICKILSLLASQGISNPPPAIKTPN